MSRIRAMPSSPESSPRPMKGEMQLAPALAAVHLDLLTAYRRQRLLCIRDCFWALPSSPVSSTRPMKGELKLAPALAAIHACTGEKHSVTLTMWPFLDSAAQAFNPSQVHGTLTAIFL